MSGMAMAASVGFAGVGGLSAGPLGWGSAGVEWVHLRTVVRTSTYTYEYSFDGVTWQGTGVELDAKVLSDDYVLQTYGGFFTGAYVGLAAVDLSGYREVAEFDHFDYRERAR